MTELKHIHFRNQSECRDWFKANHNKSAGFWMVFYKKHVKTEGVNYREALEEALCFGWIDSIIKKIDEEKYVRKFTPRTDCKNWSELNKSIVFELLKTGKMTDAGLAKIDKTVLVEIKNRKTSSSKKEKKELEVPEFLLHEFAQNEPALTHFKQLATGYKKQYVLWITSAKREETQQKRLKEAIDLLKANQKLGMK